MTTTTVTCPSCGGARRSYGFIDGIRNGRKFGEYGEIPCHTCNATGLVTEEYAARIAVGERIRRKRVEADLTGDDLARLLGMDRVALNHAEHGRPDTEEDWRKLVGWGGR